jgi:hypothetical protein
MGPHFHFYRVALWMNERKVKASLTVRRYRMILNYYWGFCDLEFLNRKNNIKLLMNMKGKFKKKL